MNKRVLISILLAVLLVPAARFLFAEKTNGLSDIDELKKSAPRVYLDGQHLDVDFIKTEIEFVNYVRDRKEADVHVLISQQDTGSGGQEYTMSFIGLGAFADQKNTLKYFSTKVETSDETRKGIVQVLKLGFAPFVARTPMAQMVNMSVSGLVKKSAVTDDWNYWVFSLSARARLSGEASWNTTSLMGNFSVNRVTPLARLRLGLSTYDETNKYDYDEYQSTSSSRMRSVDGVYVFSLNEHWSVGAFVNIEHSTYSNIRFGLSLQPAVEYNFFPYSESTRRQLRVLYRIGWNYDKYLEISIYDKLSETTTKQSLTTTLETREPWGNAEVSVEFSHLLRAFSYNRLKIQGNLSFRIVKGLSVTLDGRYSIYNDQLSLRKSEVSLEDLLLRRAELASSFGYNLSVGLSYSFGSVYSNVVNPRFGGGFGGLSGGNYWY